MNQNYCQKCFHRPVCERASTFLAMRNDFLEMLSKNAPPILLESTWVQMDISCKYFYSAERNDKK